MYRVKVQSGKPVKYWTHNIRENIWDYWQSYAALGVPDVLLGWVEDKGSAPYCWHSVQTKQTGQANTLRTAKINLEKIYKGAN